MSLFLLVLTCWLGTAHAAVADSDDAEATEPSPAAEDTEPSPAAEDTEPSPAAEATEPSPAAEATEPSPAAEPSPSVTVAKRPSYGGIFMGRSFSKDPILGGGGSMAIGSLALLRIKDTNWFAGFSVSIFGGSRLQRAATPFLPQCENGAAGYGELECLGNVATIYTDVLHIPLAGLTGYGLQWKRLEWISAAGPSLHVFSVKRFEQVSGTRYQTKDKSGEETEAESQYTPYLVGKDIEGRSKSMAPGFTLMSGLFVDIGKIPRIGGRWAVGLMGTAQGTVPNKVDIKLDQVKTSALFFRSGKDQYDVSREADSKPKITIGGFGYSVDFALMFQF